MSVVRRGLSTATQAAAETSRTPKNPRNIGTAFILNRSPFLTPSPPPFEDAFYAYQRRLSRALSSPFYFPFYFKQGSILHRRFRAEERLRNFEAWGSLSRENQRADGRSEKEKSEHVVEKVEDIPVDEDEFQALPRVTKADVERDFKSLNRAAERNLYLLVRTAGGSWEFPRSPVAGLDRPLHVVSTM